jgi:hypothetical protein
MKNETGSFLVYINEVSYNIDPEKISFFGLEETVKEQEKSYIEAKLKVSIKNGEIVSEWPYNEFRFVTDNNTQSLVVTLECEEDDVYIKRIECEKHSIVGEIKYRQNGVSKPAQYTDSFPVGTKSVAIIFSIPRKSNWAYFKVFVEDGKTKKRHDCDPLVGNDPP